MTWGIYNDPVKFISEELREKIKQSALKKEDADIDHLYKSFEKIQELNDLCTKYNIERKEAIELAMIFVDIIEKINHFDSLDHAISTFLNHGFIVTDFNGNIILGDD